MKKTAVYNHKYMMRFARTAILAALAVALSFIEGTLPQLPIPAAKPGLANIAVMISIEMDGIYGGICVMLIKSCFVFVTRGAAAGFMSLCGSALSTLIMWLAVSCDKNIFGYVGIGVLGAAAHNAGQLLAAYILLGGAVVYYVPYLLAVSAAAGTFTGIVCGMIVPKLRKALESAAR